MRAKERRHLVLFIQITSRFRLPAKIQSTFQREWGARRPPVPVAGRKPSSMPCRPSQAASVSAGSAPTRSRIICQAARLSAPSGAGPMARETEHCGQKQIRWAEDFWRGLTATVCANRYTATDFCPASSSRLQRRQYKLSKGFFLVSILARPVKYNHFPQSAGKGTSM
jgi:hypothetical protein